MVAANSDKSLLTSEEAAEYLRVSPRKLWTLSNRKEIPTVRIDRIVRYAIDDLQEFVERKKSR